MIKCGKTKEYGRKFITKVAIAMLKEKDKRININKIFNIIEDIMAYLENGDPEAYETTQQCTGMRELCRGFIVKD